MKLNTKKIIGVNQMFAIDDEVVCTMGLNKGKEFKVVALLKNGFYSCALLNEEDEKYYQFSSTTIKKK